MLLATFLCGLFRKTAHQWAVVGITQATSRPDGTLGFLKFASSEAHSPAPSVLLGKEGILVLQRLSELESSGSHCISRIGCQNLPRFRTLGKMDVQGRVAVCVAAGLGRCCKAPDKKRVMLLTLRNGQSVCVQLVSANRGRDLHV